MPDNITKAKEYCALHNIDTNVYIRIPNGDYAGSGYHTTILALAVKRFDALDVGFSSEFRG